MYTDFFGLKRKPFELSPDPSFMFPSEQSKEALAEIRYAISQRKGFVVVTGEVGTGKTLIVRSLFQWLQRERIAFANIFAPRLSVVDFLAATTSDLGIMVNEPSKGNLLQAFYAFVVAQFEKGLTTVLVIDEAHQIPTDMLEEIRMLTNVETDQQKLVQVLLVGQPELDKKLDSFELRQLKQRIAIRCRVEPLREDETGRYIERRLDLAGAGAEAKTIFPPETTRAIYSCSQGIPRVINSVSERALIIAYARQIRVVPVEIINEVASYFRLEPSSDLTGSAAKASAPDAFETQAKVGSEMSAEIKPSPESTISYEDILCNTLDVAQEVSTPLRATSGPENQLSGDGPGEFGGFDLASPNEEPPAVALPLERSVLSAASVSVTVPIETGPPKSSQDSAPTTESIPRPSDYTLPDRRPDGLRRWAEPALRLSYIQDPVQGRARQRPTAWKRALLITVSVIVVVGLVTLATDNLVAGRQNQALTVLNYITNAWETLQAGQAVASVQPAGETSAIDFKARPAAPVLRRSDSQISKSTQTPDRPTDRTKTGAVLISPGLSASTKPPLVTGTQTTDVPNGNGLLADRGTTAPGASSGGHLQPPKLVSSRPPVYPSVVRPEEVQGVVLIDALVDATGKVADMMVISGPPSLTRAAMDALGTWKYEPAQLDGRPIAMHTRVSISFSLQ